MSKLRSKSSKALQETSPKSILAPLPNQYLKPGALNVRPLFRTHLQYGALAADSMLIKSEVDTLVLEGVDAAQLQVLIPFLDGTHTLRQVLRALSGVIDSADVFSALGLLDEYGCLDTLESEVPCEAVIWHSAGLDIESVSKSLQGASVSILSLGVSPKLVDELCASLGQAGIDALASGTTKQPAFTVVLVDDYLNPELPEINRSFLASGTSWFIAKPVGRVLWFGPFFGSNEKACWACLAQRLRDNQRDELAALTKDAAAQAPPSSGLFEAASLPLLTTQISLLLGGRNRGTQTRLLRTFDHVEGASAQHFFPHRPQCPECGSVAPKDGCRLDPSELSMRPGLQLQNAVKRSSSDGGFRVCSAEETIARLSPLVSPITGIIPSLQDSVIGPFHVTKCKQISPWRADDWQRRIDLTLGAGGKGASSAQARAGCMAEAVERYCGTFQGDEPRVFGSLNALKPYAIHPNDVMGFSQKQYANRAAGKCAGYQIPELFDPDVQMDWTPLWSLREKAWRLLPTTYCYYEAPSQSGFCASNSNGCAAGNTIEEATLHGLLELIERDAIAIWWYNRLNRPPLESARLDSFASRRVADLTREQAAAGRSLALIDLTNDLGVPVIGAVSADHRSGGNIVFGFGAHLDPSIAALRAVSELVQLEVYCREAEQSAAPRMDQVRTWFAAANLESHSYLVPDRSAVPARHLELSQGTDLKGFIEDIVSLLGKRGYDVLALDCTRPDINFPVVRMVVPGLRHYHNRFAPGRLYNVPVEMGWQRSATKEGDLNPIVYFA